MMKQDKIQEILDELNGDFGYSQWFKDAVIKMLPSLQFEHGLMTICENLTILHAVDRIMCKYERFHPVACTWHDVGPKPFEGDFTAACLDDDNDILIVLQHPNDEELNLGIHVKYFDNIDGERIGFELGNVSYDEDCYVSEQDITRLIDATVNQWG